MSATRSFPGSDSVQRASDRSSGLDRDVTAGTRPATAVRSGIGRRAFVRSLLLGAGAAAAPWSLARGQKGEKVLRVGMTLSDIPLLSGQTTGGAEGIRFISFTLYDAMVTWDLTHSDRASELIPSLATSWSVDPQDQKVWTFKLRPGVKFHDGSDFDAHAVVWNFHKLMTPSAPQYDKRQATQSGNYVANVAAIEAVDDLTVKITTKIPDGTYIYSVSSVYYSSPKHWEALGKSWDRVENNPSGTGPWKFDKLVPRERLELVRNPNHWNPQRIAKCDRLVLRPISDATTRVAALLSNQIDFIEAPPPDAVPQIKAAGMQLVSNVYPHIWPYMLSYQPDSPFRDLRLRKAANLAIDRDGLVKLLRGLAMPAKGLVVPGHPWFGKPSFDIRYDPDGARKLMAEAGYGPKNKAKVKFLISSAGSGQMQPLPMNELIKENFEDAGFDVTLETLDWEALRHRRQAGSENAENRGVSGLNYSWTIQDPVFAMIGQTWHGAKHVAGYNWGGFADVHADDLALRPLQEFDVAEQNKKLADLHAYLVDQAMWIFVVHDMNPRALSSRVTGFVSAQNWYQDLAPVDLKT